ncbi:hypothetical protein XF_1631 [Xylella fastidiosa 9a5c]|uniref:Uncharacterized protein n=1 Tax=Xylella fastidiosa (strain 9a5c) TaxID=160492 RepID=Q9PCX3_XYLFA|nr:hypothetical protein XF_1631 [Xylella fastidiosa 9a5c]
MVEIKTFIKTPLIAGAVEQEFRVTLSSNDSRMLLKCNGIVCAKRAVWIDI